MSSTRWRPQRLRLAPILLVPLLLAACSGEETTFKRFAPGEGLEIRAWGVEPSTPVAGVRPIAWLDARNANEVLAVYAFGAGDPTALEMDPVSDPDEFGTIRYETQLPLMSATDDLHLYFEIRDDERIEREPSNAPVERLDFAAQLPDLPLDYVTPAVDQVAPWDNGLDLQRVNDEIECAFQYTFPFPTMTTPDFVPENRATSIASMQRGIGVDLGDGEAYFFPLQIMVWHEGSNQDMGGIRTCMTY